MPKTYAKSWIGNHHGRWISQSIRFWLPVPARKTRSLRSLEYLRALHAERPLDLIVSFGAPAVAFVQRYRQQLFATTPMVFTAVEQRRVQYSNPYPERYRRRGRAQLSCHLREYLARIARYNDRGSGEWQFSQ